MDRLAGGRSQRPGGAAGAHSAHKAWAGTFGPRPCFGFAGPLGPQNAAAPRRDPTSPSSPSPARLRQPYGGWMWAQEGRGGHAGGRRRLAARAALRAAPLACQTKERGPGPKARAPLFQDASRPAAAVRKGRCASPLERLPSTPLLTGLPPRCIRHWRRSAPAVRKGRCASPLERLPSTPLLTGLPPRCIRHWRRSAPPPLRWVFRQRQKGNTKARPHDLWGLAHETLSGRGTAPIPPPRAKPGPTAYGPGRLKPPRRGLLPQATSAPLLREYRRPRRAAGRVGPPPA